MIPWTILASQNWILGEDLDGGGTVTPIGAPPQAQAWNSLLFNNNSGAAIKVFLNTVDFFLVAPGQSLFIPPLTNHRIDQVALENLSTEDVSENQLFVKVWLVSYPNLQLEVCS